MEEGEVRQRVGFRLHVLCRHFIFCISTVMLYIFLYGYHTLRYCQFRVNYATGGSTDAHVVDQQDEFDV